MYGKVGEELMNSLDGKVFRDDILVGGGAHMALEERPNILDPRKVWGPRRPDEFRPPGNFGVSFAVILDVILNDIGGVWTGVILLPVPRFVPEHLLESWEKLVLENFSVSGTVDVADDVEWTRQSMPGDRAVDVDGRRVSVAADRLGFLSVEDPLFVVVRIVFELSGDEGGVGTHQASVPELGLRVHEVAVCFSKDKISGLEGNLSGSGLPGGNFSEKAPHSAGMTSVFLGGGGRSESVNDNGVGNLFATRLEDGRLGC